MVATHRMAKTKIYMCWNDMRDRCQNPNNTGYSRYGGRGISCDARWDKFENFLIDMGFSPSPIHSLDRIDVNGNYSKENCRWATKWEQDNNRRNNRTIEIMGHKITLAQAAREFGVDAATLGYHLDSCVDIFEAVSLSRGKRSVKRFSFMGEAVSLSEAARKIGIPRHKINYLINRRGLTFEAAVNELVRAAC